MATDFFQQQENARKSTRRLVILFGLAVLTIIVLTYIVVAIFVAGVAESTESGSAVLLDPLLLLLVGGGVIAVVGLGSFYRIASLRSGGQVVAESLGGRLLDPGSRDPDERRVLNVVEEMALASGVPVPRVYVMDKEESINAFAAGWSPEDAVVGVTRGTMQTLDRDELQGVMAHEFSHILNGDMRLNIQLIGLLNGILIIGVAGLGVMRSVRYMAIGSTMSRGSRRGNNAGGAILAILVLGAALAAIGFIGIFFGRLIKAAVSRQREYLADASAVQFTRNPDGIAGALIKIGGLTQRSRLVAANAEEASHMFFGNAISNAFSAMSTHPPLPERIRRVKPDWDGTFPKVAPRSPRRSADASGRDRRGGVDRLEETLRRIPIPGVPGAVGVPGGGPGAAVGIGTIGQTAGVPAAAQLAVAAAVIASIDEGVRDEAHNPYGARAVVHALLLNGDQAVRQRQLDHLRANTEPEIHALVERLWPRIECLEPNARLPLLEMCLPALRSMARKQYDVFRDNVTTLLNADERTTIFAWTLRRLVVQHLDRHFGLARTPRAKHYAINRLGNELATLLSVLAYSGHESATEATRAFTAGASLVGLDAGALLPANALGTDALDRALDELAQTAPRVKRQILEACTSCVTADHEVTVTEAELLRAIADTLDVPAPMG